MQNFVKGEAYSVPYGYSTQTPPAIQIQPPTGEVLPSEIPLGDRPGTPGTMETIQKGEFEPTSTVEQRRFSAPMMEWDASK